MLDSIPPPAPPLYPHPLVGAIRWDAWSGGAVTEQLEKTLEPERFHSRLPWFAKIRDVDGNTKVEIDGSSQVIMDTEIAWAAYAGIDYWAFVFYSENTVNRLSVALSHYLKSSRKNDLGFSLILTSQWLRINHKQKKEAEIERFINLLKEPTYIRVLDNRPLVYCFFKDDLEDSLVALKQKAKEEGLNPYFVYMGWDTTHDWKQHSKKGFDAVSQYASSTFTITKFNELAQKTENNFWNAAKVNQVPYIPLVTTGWNKEPRKYHNVSWEPNPPYNQQTEFVETASPDEIAIHLQRGLAFVKEHPAICKANSVIIYAWNEHDEGGWLAPTWTPSGQPNTERIEAIRRVLRF